MDLKQLEHHALSDDDIRSMVPSQVLTYPQLHQVRLKDLLKTGSAVILFLTQSKHQGHWFGLIDHPTYIEVFCSFGTRPDGWFAWLPPAKALKLNGDPVLGAMLHEQSKPVLCNTHAFQARNLSDCGRHTVCRILYKDLSLDDYLHMIQTSGMSADDFVTATTAATLK